MNPSWRLSVRSSFWACAGVLVLVLWASGAPTMVYPVYLVRWGVSSVVTTALFAVYPVVLVAVMVTCGALSDRYGRRPLLLWGVALLAMGTVLFATASLPLAFAGRALQGAGVGLALSAASAALVEFGSRGSTARASAVNTAATATGATIAIFLGGAIVEFGPDPSRLVFAVLLAASVVLFAVLTFLPDSARPAPRHDRGGMLTVPTSRRFWFVAGTGAVTVAFVTGAVFLALGAQIGAELVGASNAFLAAATLATWPAIILPTTLLSRRVTPRASVAVGGLTAAVGIAILLASSLSSSLPVFLVASVISGVGYGLLFNGGIAMVSNAASAAERAGTFSAMYLCAYLAQGVTALLIGWLATGAGLEVALDVSAPTITLMCAAIAVLAVWGRAAEPPPSIT